MEINKIENGQITEKSMKLKPWKHQKNLKLLVKLITQKKWRQLPTSGIKEESSLKILQTLKE